MNSEMISDFGWLLAALLLIALCVVVVYALWLRLVLYVVRRIVKQVLPSLDLTPETERSRSRSSGCTSTLITFLLMTGMFIGFVLLLA